MLQLRTERLELVGRRAELTGTLDGVDGSVVGDLTLEPTDAGKQRGGRDRAVARHDDYVKRRRPAWAHHPRNLFERDPCFRVSGQLADVGGAGVKRKCRDRQRRQQRRRDESDVHGTPGHPAARVLQP